MVKCLSLDRPALATGLICALLYFLYFGYCLFPAIITENHKSQIAVAFVSFPTSWLFISIFEPLLNWLGPLGSTARRVGEWSILGIAGVIQYGLIGFLAAYIISERSISETK